MPNVIRTINEIMAQERRDMFFVKFGQPFRRSAAASQSRQRHLDWFGVKGLTYELAAPAGWLEGDSNIFAVFFDGLDDPRLAEYSSIFEDNNGMSLAPEEYQMVIMAYASWSQKQP
jgi:hypothetical protein